LPPRATTNLYCTDRSLRVPRFPQAEAATPKPIERYRPLIK